MKFSFRSLASLAATTALGLVMGSAPLVSSAQTSLAPAPSAEGIVVYNAQHVSLTKAWAEDRKSVV